MMTSARSTSERWSVGIDIGVSTLKVLALQLKDGLYYLAAHAVIPRIDVTQIKKVLADITPQAAYLRVNIEDPGMKIRRVEVPNVPAEELAEIIKWGLKDILTGNVDSYVFRYQALPVQEGRLERPYLAYVLQKEVLQKRLVMLRQLGLGGPDVVEPNVSAICNAVNVTNALQPGDHYAVVDIGASIGLFAVGCSMGLLFSRPLGGVSGDTLTKQIARNLEIEEARAEELKINYPTNDLAPEEAVKLKNVMSNYFSNTVLEIQRSLDAYLAQFPNQAATKIYFTGGGAGVAGMVEYVAKTLNVTTEMLDPFHTINLENFATQMPQKMYYAVACGLALE